MTRLPFQILLIVLLAYATVVLVAYLAQGRMVFQPQAGGRALTADPGRIGLAFDDVEIETGDGERLHGWWVPHPAARGSLLLNHGNAGNISHRLDSLEIFHDLGLNVLVYDYRGYGASSGRPSEAGVYRDAAAALEWMRDRRGVRTERLVVFGRSMGAAVAARVARDSGPACLILESPFTSLPDRAAEIYPWLPVRLLLHIEMNTRKHVADSDLPVLVIHSRDDEIVPFGHGREVAGAAGENARLLEIRGDHNSGFVVSRPSYVAGLQAFVEKCGL